MKKFAAIFLLFIFLFNLVGYRLWFSYTQEQSDDHLKTLLDKNEYNEDELITIKIPLSMPYQIDRQEFERVDGEINLHGEIYKYVKRKVQDGELILQCLPDKNKMRLETAKEDFFKNTNDLATNNNSKKSNNSKALDFNKLMSEYDQNTFVFNNNIKVILSQSYCIINAGAVISSPHTPPGQPPDLA